MTSEFETIEKLMPHGHICMYQNEAEFLANIIKNSGNGDHVEIGSMWGGSAILAARAKKTNGLSGKVACIDPFRDMDCSPGGSYGHPTASMFWKNVKACGVYDVIELIECLSHPWPLGDMKFATALVDGDHLGDWPLIDWSNVKRVSGIVIYHDLYPHERDVMRCAEIIRNDPEWREIGQVGSLAAWERVK